jgi:glutathione peroxidase
MTKIYEFTVKDIKGKDVSLQDYKGKTLLILNTASKCGFTGQYEGLEEIYKEYKSKGLEIMAFPCNQFGKQEPGSNEEIAEFCDLSFKTSFPLFSKIDVNGDKASPLFEYLKAEAPGLLGSKKIKWNFTKFLVNGDGTVLKRYAPKDKPEKIATELGNLLS